MEITHKQLNSVEAFTARDIANRVYQRCSPMEQTVEVGDQWNPDCRTDGVVCTGITVTAEILAEADRLLDRYMGIATKAAR